MGAQLSLLAPTASTVALSSYVEVLGTVQYLEILGNTRFLKTIKAIDEQGYVTLKLFVKPNDGSALDLKLTDWKELMIKQNGLLSRFANVLPYTNVIETDRAGYLIRQYCKTNLYDRLNTRPFLNPFEKRWMIFQLLNILVNIHSVNIKHGDIKLENFLVTSWNWILLSDFAPFKPIYLPQDNPTQFSFYFDSSQRRICYIAPERFIGEGEEHLLILDSDQNQDHLTKEMDIFSLGCVIAELYLDGNPIFTLSQLYKYKRNDYSPDLSEIDDPFIKNLILQMIHLDPTKRPSAESLLRDYKAKIFPNLFYDFLYDYIGTLSKNSNSDYLNTSDSKIDKIYNDFEKISKALSFHFDEVESQNEFTREAETKMMPFKINLPGVKDYVLKSTSQVDQSEDSALIILNLTFANLRNTSHSLYRIKSCELMLAFSEKVSDEYKLDRVLPYLVHLLDDLSSQVKVTALKSITQLLLMVDSITPVNESVFTEYLIPKLNQLTNTSTSDSYVRISLAGCLPYLAQSAMKFWSMTNIFKTEIFNDSNFPTPNQITGNSFMVSAQSTKNLLYLEFENLTVNFLTDSNFNVKISLLRNILPLCYFFGRDRTNDVILSHLITYLNDKNSELRITFIETIVGIGVFIGPTSLEQYLLPLLIQTLIDPEEFVVINVLTCFVTFNKLGLIKKHYYWDLIKIINKLFVHPNEWIRQCTLSLVISIVEKLSLADVYCYIYPLIRPFLEYDLTDFNWENLYPCLCKPLSRSAYNLCMTWCVKADKTLFWKQMSLNDSKVDKFGNVPIVFHISTSHKSKTDYSVSLEDQGWLNQLKSIGVNDKDIWKISVFRDYLVRVTRLSSRMNNSGNFNKVSFSEIDMNLELQKMGVPPRNVFFDTSFKSETFNNPQPTQEIAGPDFAKYSNTFQSQVKSNNNSSSSLFLGASKAKPSIQTYQETAFGELEIVHEDHQVNKNILSNGNKIVTTKVTNSYQGKNPYILKYLNSISFEPCIDEFSEFGAPIIDLPIKSTNLNWRPKGKLVAYLSENDSPVNCVAVSPTSNYFLTGSNEGSLKLWDCYRLEKNVTCNSSLSLNLNSAIVQIKFIFNREVFCVATKDGKIKLFKTEYLKRLNNSGNYSFKYLSFKLVRDYQLPDREYVNCSDFLISTTKSLLICTTTKSRILAFDIITMKSIFESSTLLYQGVPTSFIIDQENCWLVLGTNKGYLQLWDMRFEFLLKAWKFKQGFPIHKIKLLPTDFSMARKSDRFLCIIGGSGEPEVTLWDVSKLQCRQILSASESSSDLKNYSIPEVRTSENEEDELSNLLENGFDFGLNNEKKADNSMTSVSVFETVADNRKEVFIICATAQHEIISWNINHPENSSIISGKPFEMAYSFRTTQINSTLTVVNQVLQHVDEVTSDDRSSSKSKRKRRNRIGMVSQEQMELIRNHHDLISDIGTAIRPYEMVVSVDRSGVINIYK